MSRQPHDDQIDRLYQIPLDEFTAARNALAKELGKDAPDLKRLAKPIVAAWAVNQLYWHERRIYDDVIGAADRVRDAYRQQLAGKAVDVKSVEATHRDALRKAMQAIRAILEGPGAKASEAVMTAVSETLDALPAGEQPGRLTSSLRRTGFEALQGFAVATTATREKPKDVPAKLAPPPKARADQDRPISEVARRDREMTIERLRFAEAAQREAEAALERTRRAVERADRTRERIAQELAEATHAANTLRKEETTRQAAYVKAVAERERLAKRFSG